METAENAAVDTHTLTDEEAVRSARRIEISERALELLAQWQRPIIIHTDITHVVGMIGLVQLALRHPEAKEMSTARILRDFMVELIEQIDPTHGEIWTFLHMGFNPEHDT
jgi:hypothetical protein